MLGHAKGFMVWLGTKTLKREFAALAVLVWAAVSFHLFFGIDPIAAAAQAVNYGTLSSTVWLYVAAAVGLAQWDKTAGPSAPAKKEKGE